MKYLSTLIYHTERVRQRHLLRDRGLEVVRALQELPVLAVGAESRDGALRARDEVREKRGLQI